MGPDRVFRGRVRDRGAYPAVAAFVVVLAVVVGIGLLPVDGEDEWLDMRPSSAPASSPARVASSPPADASDAAPDAADPAAGTGNSGAVDISPAVPGPLPPFPPWGELVVGEFQFVGLDGVGIAFSVPAAGWHSGGPNAARNGGFIVRRAAGTERGLVAFSSPDRIYVDPCGHKLGSPVGPAAVDLAAALATIPGVDARMPGDVRVGGFPTKQVVLTIREDAGCVPDRFYLWADPLEGPRRAWGVPSTIVVWIVDLTSDPHVVKLAGGTQRVVIETELLNGAGPEIDREIGQIIDSIAFAG